MAKTSILNLKAKNLDLPKAARLVAWYRKNGRELPWRSHNGRGQTPYHTWISEIMLQQTTVATVISYYERFIARWPNIMALAKAADDDVLGAWAGLGYYRRARMLHACAKVVAADYKGKFPQDIIELKKLPGIGDYTANAIRAIAFDLPANVVDGNVERVIARIFAFDKPINIPANKKALKELAAKIVPKTDHGDYAQALMDLGATICTPKKPLCEKCPWNTNCLAFARGIQPKLPVIVRAKKTPQRFAAAFFAINKKGQVLLQQRPVDGLLGGLWELPSTDWRLDEAWTDTEITGDKLLNKIKPKSLEKDVIHVFTHFKLTTSLYTCSASAQIKQRFPQAQWCDLDDLPPLSTLTKKLVQTSLTSLGATHKLE